MSRKESIGITGVEAVHFYVNDVERSRRFYTDKLDFAEIGKSSEELEGRSNQKSYVFRAGEMTVVCSQPTGEGGRAWRYLRRHPDGVGSVTYRVEDVERAFHLLSGRGATPLGDIERFSQGEGRLSAFSVATPFGSTTFRFVERRGFEPLFPGIEEYETPKGGNNALGFGKIDHITSNFMTLEPALTWLEEVLGCEKYWGVEFHTTDVGGDEGKGSGLRSVVMYEPNSGIKFANNEPWRPYFRDSQIFLFTEDNRGDGVQHIALTVDDIVGTVKAMRERNVEFMPTPGTYYDMLPERIEKLGIGSIDEPIDTLRDLEILVDGEKGNRYLLQIFLREAAGLYSESEAGPFFYEVIQRKGDEGFGAGNFRALFESIERKQRDDGRV